MPRIISMPTATTTIINTGNAAAAGGGATNKNITMPTTAAASIRHDNNANNSNDNDSSAGDNDEHNDDRSSMLLAAGQQQQQQQQPPHPKGCKKMPPSSRPIKHKQPATGNDAIHPAASTTRPPPPSNPSNPPNTTPSNPHRHPITLTLPIPPKTRLGIVLKDRPIRSTPQWFVTHIAPSSPLLHKLLLGDMVVTLDTTTLSGMTEEEVQKVFIENRRGKEGASGLTVVRFVETTTTREAAVAVAVGATGGWKRRRGDGAENGNGERNADVGNDNTNNNNNNNNNINNNNSNNSKKTRKKRRLVKKPKWPLNNIRRKRCSPGYVISQPHDKNNNATKYDILPKIEGYISELAWYDGCFTVYGSGKECTCMHFLRDANVDDGDNGGDNHDGGGANGDGENDGGGNENNDKDSSIKINKPNNNNNNNNNSKNSNSNHKHKKVLRAISNAILKYQDLPSIQKKEYLIDRLRFGMEYEDTRKMRCAFVLPMSYNLGGEDDEHDDDDDDDDDDENNNENEDVGGGDKNGDGGGGGVDKDDADGNDSDEDEDMNKDEDEGNTSDATNSNGNSTKNNTNTNRNRNRNNKTNNKNNNNNNSQQDMAILGKAYQHRICIWAWLALHNVSSDVYNQIKGFIEGKVIITPHKNTGRSRRSEATIKTLDELRQWLNALVDQYGTGIKSVYLPRGYSKRKCWMRWIKERGWNVKMVNPALGRFEKMADWETMPGFYKTEEEALENGGEVAKHVVNWGQFCELWKTEFAHLNAAEWQVALRRD